MTRSVSSPLSCWSELRSDRMGSLLSASMSFGVHVRRSSRFVRLERILVEGEAHPPADPHLLHGRHEERGSGTWASFGRRRAMICSVVTFLWPTA